MKISFKQFPFIKKLINYKGKSQKIDNPNSIKVLFYSLIKGSSTQKFHLNYNFLNRNFHSIRLLTSLDWFRISNEIPRMDRILYVVKIEPIKFFWKLSYSIWMTNPNPINILCRKPKQSKPTKKKWKYNQN